MINMIDEEDTFSVKLPISLRSWIESNANTMGLPSVDNFVLLLVRITHQRQYLLELGIDVSVQLPTPSRCSKSD